MKLEVTLFGGGFIQLLVLLFIGLKLGKVIMWSWWWVLSPLLAGLALTLIVIIVLIIILWLYD